MTETTKPIRLGVKKLHPDAIIPRYANPGDACFDLHSIDYASMAPGESRLLRTGLAFDIPAGYVMRIYSRSGHGFKHGVRLANCVGVIDSGYRGEVMVKLVRDIAGAGRDQLVIINEGDRIAQALLEPIPAVDLVEVANLTETQRGANGFGSSGA